MRVKTSTMRNTAKKSEISMDSNERQSQNKNHALIPQDQKRLANK